MHAITDGIVFIDKWLILEKNTKGILHIIIAMQYSQLVNGFPEKVVLSIAISVCKKSSSTILHALLTTELFYQDCEESGQYITDGIYIW